MSKHVAAVSPIIILVIVCGFILALAFLVAGTGFVYMGTTGDTTFTFFGQSFQSKNVGIAALFLGAVTFVLVLRRTLASLDKVVATEAPSSKALAEPPVQAWPHVKTETTFKNAITNLSETQWHIFKAVAAHDGVATYTLMQQRPVGPSEFHHRLQSMAHEELVVLTDQKVFLADQPREFLKKIPLEKIRNAT